MSDRAPKEPEPPRALNDASPSELDARDTTSKEAPGAIDEVGSQPTAKGDAAGSLQPEASAATHGARSAAEPRRRPRRRARAATEEGSDPPLFPRGRMLVAWLLLVLVMPIFVGIAGPLYADGLRRREREERDALEAKRRSKLKAQERAKQDALAAYERGRSLRDRGDLAEAIEEFSTFLSKTPNHADAHWLRGLSRFELQDLLGAQEDFDAVIRQQPTHAAALRSRGQVRALLGDRAGGLEDYQASFNLRADPYPMLWIVGLGGDADKLRAFAVGADWTSSVASYYLDRISEEDLLARAKATDAEATLQERLCEAHGYIGLRAEREGDTVKAMRHYRRCVDTGVTSFIEYRWAIVRLNQEAQGNLPSLFNLEKD